jgi:phytoene dehydrogenase-like protein
MRGAVAGSLADATPTRFVADGRGQTMTDVAVVGGGLAGLVAARRLAEAGRDVQVFERRAEVGGRVRSVHRDGFTFDRGFQVLFTAYPAAKRHLDFDALDLREFAPGATLARPGRRTTLSDPFRDPGGALASLTNTDVRLTDKLRVLALRRELRRRDADGIFPGEDRSIEQYLAARGFSRAFVERFAAPFYGGITLDRSLSTAAAVFEYTFKMLSEGAIAVPAGGMGDIPAHLAAAARDAGARIDTGSEVTSVATEPDGVTLSLGGETVAADAAVVATDPPTARSLTGVESVPTDGRGCVTQYCTLPASADLDTGTRLLLNVGDSAPNQVAPMSAVAPEYAPDDRQLLAATFLGRPDETDEELAGRTRETLASWYPSLDTSALAVRHTERVTFAQFDQPPGVHADLPDVTAPDGPVVLAGDYTDFSSIQGALQSGERAAEALLRDGA